MAGVAGVAHQAAKEEGGASGLWVAAATKLLASVPLLLLLPLPAPCYWQQLASCNNNYMCHCLVRYWCAAEGYWEGSGLYIGLLLYELQCLEG